MYRRHLRFKSDRGGIETLMRAIATFMAAWFKSDRGGIETTGSTAGAAVDVDVQIRPWRD